MALLNKELLKNKKPELKKININDFDCYIKKLSAGKLIELSKHNDKDDIEQMVYLIISCACDESGKLLFDNNDKDLLLDQDADMIKELFSQIANHVGLLDDEIENESKN